MILLPQSPDLLRIQTSHGKHANLDCHQSNEIDPVPPSGKETYIGEYMVPRPRRATLLKPFDQSLTHRPHAPAHMREINQPLRRQLLVSKNFRDNSGTVDGRSRDLCAGKPRKHGESLGLSGLCSTHYVQSTHALAVQTEVFGEGLCYEQYLRSVAQEVSNGPCVVG